MSEKITRCDECGKKVVIFFDILPEDCDYSVLCIDCWDDGIRRPLPVFIGLPAQ